MEQPDNIPNGHTMYSQPMLPEHIPESVPEVAPPSPQQFPMQPPSVPMLVAQPYPVMPTVTYSAIDGQGLNQPGDSTLCQATTDMKK